MICNSNLLCRARTTTATIALIAGGYLLMSGTTAERAAGQGWSTEVLPSTSQTDRAEGQAEPMYVGASKSGGDNTAEPAARAGGLGNKDDLFRPGPQYDANYNAEGNVDIYGAKKAVEPPRPPVELGRQQYTSGQYEESSTIFGALNPLLPGLAIYGDWRTAIAYNGNDGKDVAQIATRLNIDIDLKLTGTERIHAFFTPIQKANQFTRFEFDRSDGDGKFTDEFDFNPQTLFFEGDLGAIMSGFSGEDAGFDLPFTVGLFPLFLQNGIWANDAILGGAVTLPAKNSAKLGLPNYDITFFAAFDNVDNAGILGLGNNSNANIYGLTTFIDGFDGYVEAGYAVIEGKDDVGLAIDGSLTHFLTAAYSRRYGGVLSNSTRFFANFGDGNDDEGYAVISENSLIMPGGGTLIPYANFFVGFERPQPLVDGNGAGILKNVGINFETDALTGYPKLNDTGADAYGGAIGLTYLFGADLGQQFVVEFATVQPFEEANEVPGAAQDSQYAFGVRYQIALTRAWLLRADATYQIKEEQDQNDFGVRMELRRKF
jgi:hypothetical protein